MLHKVNLDFYNVIVG